MQPKGKLLLKNNIHMNFRFPGRPDTMMTRFEINDQIFTYDKLNIFLIIYFKIIPYFPAMRSWRSEGPP